MNFSFLYRYLRHYSFEFLFLILCICSVSYIIYSGYSHPASRVPDYSETLKYIEYFSMGKGGLPSFNYCWVCHHPPLYYWLCSKLVLLGIDLRILSLFISIITILVVYFLLRSFVSGDTFWDRFIVLFLTLVYGLWPYTIIFSGRVHNDILFNLLFLASLVFFVKFVISRVGFYFFCGIFFTFLCILTKSTGLVLVLVGLVSLVFVSCSKFKLPVFFSRILLLVLLVFVPIYMNVVGRDMGFAYDKLIGLEGLKSLLLGNAGIVEERFWVGNSLINYLWFDIPGYFYSPVMLASEGGGDASGRQYFLNHLVKSSLFGTYNDFLDLDVSYLLDRILGYGMSFLLLVMICLLFISFFRLGKVLLEPRVLVILTSGLLLFISIISFRYSIPTPHHGDFRLVYPLLPIGLCIMALALTKSSIFKISYVFRFFTIGTFGLFSIFSFLYFLPLSGLSSYLFRDIVSYDYEAFKDPKEAGSSWNSSNNHVFMKDQVVRIDFDDISKDRSRYFEISTDSNEDYVIILKSHAGEVDVLLKPASLGMSGLSLARFEINWDKLKGENLDHVLIYPLAFESELGIAKSYGFDFDQDAIGDDRYSLGHFRFLP